MFNSVSEQPIIFKVILFYLYPKLQTHFAWQHSKMFLLIEEQPSQRKLDVNFYRLNMDK